jgi:glucose/arabinose dehydrogenase
MIEMKNALRLSLVTSVSLMLISCLTASQAFAADSPDGLVLPEGFHASVVADGIEGARHLAFRDNDNLYVSTRGEKSTGLVAIHLDAVRKADKVEHFSTADGGTGIRFYHGSLYASSPVAVFKFEFSGDDLIPKTNPITIVEGMPASGFSARPLAFDGRGAMFVGLGGGGNTCVAKDTPKGAPPVGLEPCPDLNDRAGVWRFDANKVDQKFPLDGKRIVTGVRDIDAMDWRPGDALYGVVHDRNGTSRTWPNAVSSADESAIAEEMHRFVPGANLGWPYAYYDRVRPARILAPEYGGDGKTEAKAGSYTKPVTTFSGHSAPLDLVFYNGAQFPKVYRGGAFVVFHGGMGPNLPDGHNGYNVMFVPFDRNGKLGDSEVFAEGFAGPNPADKNASTAHYRPVGAAVAPDGSLYIADSKKGRIWRIYYQ